MEQHYGNWWKRHDPMLPDGTELPVIIFSPPSSPPYLRMPFTKESIQPLTQLWECFGRSSMSSRWRRRNSSYVSIYSHCSFIKVTISILLAQCSQTHSCYEYMRECAARWMESADLLKGREALLNQIQMEPKALTGLPSLATSVPRVIIIGPCRTREWLACHWFCLHLSRISRHI